MLLSKPDMLNDAFSVHKLARGQVAKREMEYCMEKKIQIKVHHIVMVYHSTSWAKCQSDWHNSCKTPTDWNKSDA